MSGLFLNFNFKIQLAPSSLSRRRRWIDLANVAAISAAVSVLCTSERGARSKQTGGNSNANLQVGHAHAQVSTLSRSLRLASCRPLNGRSTTAAADQIGDGGSLIRFGPTSARATTTRK